ncbi:MAG: site-specific integrase, partial [Phaeodactylibacter sp.]|nr:site-specific integrase [Phaeodactylibacter sp.]
MYFKTVCWKYAPRQDGTCSVKVYVNLHRQQKYYPVEGIYVTPQDFDDKRGIVRPKHPLSKVYNSKIRAFRNKVEEHFIKGGGFDEIGTNDSGSLLKFVDKYITESQVLSKGTKRNYRSLEFR